jgi:hypothetical protein
VLPATDLTGKMPVWGALLIVVGVLIMLAIFTVFLFVCSKKRDLRYRNALIVENAEDEEV